jgi:hypothetical protein
LKRRQQNPDTSDRRRNLAPTQRHTRILPDTTEQQATSRRQAGPGERCRARADCLNQPYRVTSASGQDVHTHAYATRAARSPRAQT